MDSTERSRIKSAFKEWFDIKDAQAKKAIAAGKAQSGNRAAVTGGGHLRGVNQLILDEIIRIGAPGISHFTNRKAELPGWYRRSKQWDLLVLQHGNPILVVEYKSMKGSVGKNSNNRLDEVIGVAEDARKATEEGLLPENMRRAYIYLLEISDEAVRVNRPTRPAGSPDIMFHGDEIFDNTSYLDRFGITAQRMRQTGLLDLVWVVGVKRDPLGFEEPFADTGWDRFAQDLRTEIDWQDETK